MPKPTVDPWLLQADGTEDPFARVDFGVHNDDLIDDPDVVQTITPELNPEVITTPAPAAEVPVVQAPPEPEPEDGPETFQFDGATATLEKDKGQWKATVVNDTGGNPQVYWGKTKNELIANLLKAQANATKKIRDQNRQIKLGGVAEPKQAPRQPVVQPQARELSADEIFEVKTLLESNPAAAFETWLQKRTGMTADELVAMRQDSRRGSKAAIDLDMDTETREFLSNNPDYIEHYKLDANFVSIMKWLAKFKLGTALGRNFDRDQLMVDLYNSGAFTAENLEEAYLDLKEDGQLEMRPKTPPPVAVQQQEPAPAPRPEGRIVNTVTRPRAALGIQRSDVTPTPQPEAPKAPSAEELDSLDDATVKRLFEGARRHAVVARRS